MNMFWINYLKLMSRYCNLYSSEKKSTIFNFYQFLSDIEVILRVESFCLKFKTEYRVSAFCLNFAKIFTIIRELLIEKSVSLQNLQKNFKKMRWLTPSIRFLSSSIRDVFGYDALLIKSVQCTLQYVIILA